VVSWTTNVIFFLFFSIQYKCGMSLAHFTFKKFQKKIYGYLILTIAGAASVDDPK
jgi:hypothetical protein